MHKNFLTVVGITILFLGVVATPMTLGYDVETSLEQPDTERYLYPEYYNCYSVDEIDGYVEYHDTDVSIEYEPVGSTKPLNSPPMDSPWPMYCHDIRHTGRSPYSTVDTCELKWRFETKGNVLGSPVIDNNGILYVGAHNFYAVYPNGTLKWEYDIPHYIDTAAAIDDNGIIYVGNVHGDTYLFAFYPNGTLKWKYRTVDDVRGSPVIGNDGTIYFGTEGSSYPNYSGYIIALYPNGTLRWRYKTNHFVYSDPAIGDDGTVYCGSHDGYLYALYPNNGTLKWKYKTGDWVGRGPSIADDDTIYFGSWDGYLYAVYPNGTLKWKLGGNLAGTTPVIAQDGTIYIGNRKLTAVNPDDGSVKWSFDPGPDNIFITSGNPCISVDGIIYFGTDNFDDGTGEVIALNPNGTERWRYRMGPVQSAPAIGKDGTVYIGCSTTEDGYLNAFGKLDQTPPSAPDIDGPKRGIPEINYNFSFVSTEPNNQRIKYYVDWGDGNTIETNYHESGEVVTLNHTWKARKTYTIKAIAEDFHGEQSNESSLKITIPRNKVANFSFNLISWFSERFPLLEVFLRVMNLLR